ncbi:MAG: hypothetical protein ACERKO_03305 [Acetanaerobacterium sp.]
MMTLQTQYGALTGVALANYYDDGTLKDCVLGERNVLTLPCGALVPQYGEEHVRRKNSKSLSFFRSGALKAALLEEQQGLSTPMGEFPAELVTFYETGEMRRVFPLNGKLSGYWSEQDESQLAFPFQFEFSFGTFAAKIVGLHFYQSGALKSLTLFPGEVVTLATPIGDIAVKTGFSLYESGALRSVEPAQPVVVMTDIGPLAAYDCNALGIHADSNSLCFYEQGGLYRLTSSSDRIAAISENGKMTLFAPLHSTNLPDEEAPEVIPLTLTFEEDKITIADDTPHVFDPKTARLNSLPYLREDGMSCSPSDCASCGGTCGM